MGVENEMNEKEQTWITLNSGRKVTAFEYDLMARLGRNVERMVSTMPPVEPELEDVPPVVEDVPPVVVANVIPSGDAPVAQPKPGLINTLTRFFRRGKR